MNDVKLSIIIKSNCDMFAISSLMQQNNDSWECFIVDNTVKDIEQYVKNNKHFIIAKEASIDNIIQHANGDYILLINSNDILVPDTVYTILHMIEFTNADIIKINSNKFYDSRPDSPYKKYTFKYIFNKKVMMDYIFNNPSEFCFKKNIISDKTNSEHVLLANSLIKAKDMAVTTEICLINQNNHNITVSDIVNNYQANKEKLSKDFWKKYFEQIAPQIISEMAKTNNKKTFLDFCRQIPLNLIPLRYRIICYIISKTNK